MHIFISPIFIVVAFSLLGSLVAYFGGKWEHSNSDGKGDAGGTKGLPTMICFFVLVTLILIEMAVLKSIFGPWFF